MFDMVEELAAIHREVVRDEDAQTVSVALPPRTTRPKADDVWDALTKRRTPAALVLPGQRRPRVGGTFQTEGNAGGEIRRCERPTALQVTFGAPDSIIDVRLANERKNTPPWSSPTRSRWRWPAAGRVRSSSLPAGTVPCSGSACTCAARPSPIPSTRPTPPRSSNSTRGSIDRWTDVIESSGSATPDEVAKRPRDGNRAVHDGAILTTSPSARVTRPAGTSTPAAGRRSCPHRRIIAGTGSRSGAAMITSPS